MMVWFLWKKTLKHGGGGGWKICTPNLLDISNFLFGLCLGVISAGRIPGRCPSTRWGAVLAPIFWAPKSYTSRHLLPLPWDLLIFFGRLQDIQGLGTCFIWVAELFFWVKRRETFCGGEETSQGYEKLSASSRNRSREHGTQKTGTWHVWSLLDMSG